MYKVISSFDCININGSRPLVICDIDETVITFANGIKTCQTLAQELGEKDFNYIYNLYKTIKPPIQTDPEGFDRLKNRLNQSGISENLMFLTARNELSIQKTAEHFTQVGLDYNAQPVHYTNNQITKGEYICRNINLDDYDQIIFIDDYPSYIQSVLEHLPQIECYLFVYQRD
jgi:hypothetical protein